MVIVLHSGRLEEGLKIGPKSSMHELEEGYLRGCGRSRSLGNSGSCFVSWLGVLQPSHLRCRTIAVRVGK